MESGSSQGAMASSRRGSRISTPVMFMETGRGPAGRLEAIPPCARLAAANLHALWRNSKNSFQCACSDCVRRPRESRPARGDVAVARSIRIRADPEGVERSVREVKAELHRLAGELRQISGALPFHLD